jgi:hypothetical protein
MKSLMKHMCLLPAVLLVAQGGGTALAAGGQVTMHSEGEVAADGLYLTRAAFGTNINIRDSMITVYKGYIFVSWYKGGFEDRTVWLSRKPVGKGRWQHIRFPHRHVMFRRDKNLPENEKRGDAHNNIAIGICPKDDTIHLLYDMHAYTPKDFPEDYFNYSYTKKGAATVPDEKWTIDLFLPKQNYLNPDVPRARYYSVTYPAFRTTPDDHLIVTWRVGGTHDAFMHFNEYDGERWSAPRLWNDTRGDKQVGFYGGFSAQGGRLFARWTHRSKGLEAAGFPHGGQAVYAAYSEKLNGAGPWFNLKGETFELPLKDFEPFKVLEAESPSQKAWNGSTLLLPSGDLQLAFHAGKRTTLATLPKGGARFNVTTTDQPVAGGQLHGDELYEISLEDNTPLVYSTKLGSRERKLRYRYPGDLRFSHGAFTFHEGSFFYYLQQSKPDTEAARPLHVFRFDLP